MEEDTKEGGNKLPPASLEEITLMGREKFINTYVRNVKHPGFVRSLKLGQRLTFPKKRLANLTGKERAAALRDNMATEEKQVRYEGDVQNTYTALTKALSDNAIQDLTIDSSYAEIDLECDPFKLIDLIRKRGLHKLGGPQYVSDLAIRPVGQHAPKPRRTHTRLHTTVEEGHDRSSQRRRHQKIRKRHLLQGEGKGGCHPPRQGTKTQHERSILQCLQQRDHDTTGTQLYYN